MHLIRLPLEGTTNTRDLGGYPCNNNKYTKWKKVLRSDCLSKLTKEDKKFLIDKYNLKKVIDLRSVDEINIAANAFSEDTRVEYVNISLADDVDPNKVVDINNISENFLRDFYINLIEDKMDNIKKVIQEIADIGENDSVIFHCTAGKDRTGVIAMLLLGICGVSKQDIATNYMQTATNLKYNTHFTSGMKKLAEEYNKVLGEEVMKKMSSSNEENIEYTYDKLIDKYGSFKEFFLHLGISENEMNKIIDVLTEDMS